MGFNMAVAALFSVLIADKIIVLAGICKWLVGLCLDVRAPVEQSWLTIDILLQNQMVRSFIRKLAYPH